eukprot:PhF_6_TR36049/c0_g1_i2/m.52297
MTIPPRTPVPPGKTRICIAGYKVSTHTGRARSIASLIAQRYPGEYETWFYFTWPSKFHAFTQTEFANVTFPPHLKGHGTAPFVWLEKSGSGEGILPLGGREHFIQWVVNTFPNDAVIKAECTTPSMLDAFRVGSSTKQMVMPPPQQQQPQQHQQIQQHPSPPPASIFNTPSPNLMTPGPLTLHRDTSPDLHNTVNHPNNLQQQRYVSFYETLSRNLQEGNVYGLSQHSSPTPWFHHRPVYSTPPIDPVLMSSHNHRGSSADSIFTNPDGRVLMDWTVPDAKKKEGMLWFSPPLHDVSRYGAPYNVPRHPYPDRSSRDLLYSSPTIETRSSNIVHSLYAGSLSPYRWDNEYGTRYDTMRQRYL